MFASTKKKHVFARTNQECRRYFSSSSSVGEIHPSDKTIIKRGIYQLGSNVLKIKESPSTHNGRKLINVASPLAKTQKLANLCNQEESDGSNVVSGSSALKVENLPLTRIAEASITIKGVSIPADFIQQSVDCPLATDMKLSHSPEGYSMENEHDNSYFQSGKRSPTLTKLLRKISNRLKTVSSQPINMRTRKTDGSCNMQFAMDGVEPKIPKFQFSSKVDCSSLIESFVTAKEIFKTRSTVLKGRTRAIEGNWREESNLHS